MQSNHSESLFSKLTSLVTVDGLYTPLGPALSGEELIEEAVHRLHENAISCGYDPVDRILLVFSNGKLKGWTRFDFLSLSENRHVKDETLAFGEYQIVSSNTSVMSIVHLFRESEEQLFFVVSGNVISGTVRYADLFSQEFRLCLFALSLELEEVSLRRLAILPEESFTLLSGPRQEAARNVFNLRYPGRQMDFQTLLKCTTFIDKGTMVIKSRTVTSYSPSHLKKSFSRIERIRNHCAHPSGNRSEWLVLSQPDVLAETISSVNSLIEQMGQIGI
jgi:hypothetical protein